MGICLVPLGLFAGTLTFVQLLQNEHWRFQAPVSMAVVFLLIQMSAWALERCRGSLQRITVLSVLIPVLLLPLSRGARRVPYIMGGQTEVRGSYMDTFAARLGRIVQENHVIALTEAGRVPYWSRAYVDDLIGLNSSSTALGPPSAEYLRSLDPDLIMFHHVWTLDFGRLRDRDLRESAFVSLTPDELDDAVKPAFRTLYHEGVRSYAETRVLSTRIVPLILVRYLMDSGGFDVFAVDEAGDGTFLHIYATRKGWSATSAILDSLETISHPDSRRSSYRSYLDLKRNRKSIRTHS